MILDKLRDFLGFKKKGDEKEIVISCERLEKRVAFLEGGRLEEFSIERDSDRQISGSIYKGRVKNLEPGLKAMFVDIGLDKNAFLHYWDAIPAALDPGVEAIERQGGKRKSQKRITANDIPKIYPPGSDIIVQVTKGPIGTKGPRITTNISLAGRYLVLMPYSDQCGISRKIEDPKERQRLRRILGEMNLPDGMGVIIRTVGEGQKARFFVRDLHVLLEQWQRIWRSPI
jgi:ribonuclease G